MTLLICLQLSQFQDLPKELTVSLPMVTLLSCGKSSPGKVKLMKEVMLIPPAGLTVKQVLHAVNFTLLSFSSLDHVPFRCNP